MQYTQVHVYPCSAKNYCLPQVPTKRAAIDFSVVIDVVSCSLLFNLFYVICSREKARLKTFLSYWCRKWHWFFELEAGSGRYLLRLPSELVMLLRFVSQEKFTILETSRNS